MTRDWVAWHRSYEGDTPLARRLAVVQRRLADALDAAPPGEVQILSLCAGQGRDVIGVLRDHPRRHDVVARLVELDPVLVADARADTNTVGWLLWHTGREVDAQVAPIAGAAKVWEGGGWAPRVGLEPDPRNMGHGHTPAEVADVRPDGPDAVTGSWPAVAAQMAALLDRTGAADLDRVVDAFEHLGQAAYARGVLDRSS